MRVINLTKEKLVITAENAPSFYELPDDVKQMTTFTKRYVNVFKWDFVLCELDPKDHFIYNDMEFVYVDQDPYNIENIRVYCPETVQILSLNMDTPVLKVYES